MLSVAVSVLPFSDISCGSFNSFLAAEGFSGISSSETSCTRRLGDVLSPSDANSRNKDWCEFECAGGYRKKGAADRYTCEPSSGDGPSVGVWTGDATCESCTYSVDEN